MAATGAYASALQNLRDNVKWTVAAFTGAGAIIFSGLSVTNISRLAENQAWVLPVLLAALPLLAAIVAIVFGHRVMAVAPPPVKDLLPKYWHELKGTGLKAPSISDALAAQLPAAVAVYGSLDDFDTRLVQAGQRVKSTRAALQNTNTPENRADYAQALMVLDGLQPTVEDVFACATYVDALKRYKLGSAVTLGAVLLALGGLIASGVASGQRVSAQEKAKAAAASAAPPTPLAFRDPTPVAVYFDPDSPPPAAAGGARHCPVWSGMNAEAVGGSFVRPLVLFPGYAKADARTSLPVPDRCDEPWLWSAEAGQVRVRPR